MPLDKSLHYVFRIGSNNQHRLHWDGKRWHYEFLAGGVLFDELHVDDESQLDDAVSVHGLTLDKFVVDTSGQAESYSREIQDKMKQLTSAGIVPCPKHGLMSKNTDGTCEACENTDYWDDHKGTEG